MRGRDDEPVDLELRAPVDRAVALAEILEELGCDPRSHLVREPGRDDDAEDRARALLARPLGLVKS